MWILGTLHKEMAFLYLPGTLSVLVAILFPALGETSIIYALLATALIDSGHVYTTAWRTFLHPDEMRSSKLYFIVPVVAFVVFSSWHILGFKGLWSFVVYATLFHHVRQVYGLSKWYQALNKRPDRISDYFLYALAILPMVAYHFRPEVPNNYYSHNDLFLFPNINVLKGLYLIYACVLASWIIYEMRIWKEGKKELNRILSVAFPALVYGYCFFVGKTVSQILFPLLFIHGVAYVGILSQTLNRTQTSRFRTFMVSLLVVVMTAVIFGLGESWMENNMISVDPSTEFWPGLLIGLWLTPLFCHYFFDALIWKRTHRESAALLGKSH